MKKIISIVGLFLGLLMVGRAEAGFVTTNSTGSLVIGVSTSVKLTSMEQVDITSVRLGSATQLMNLSGSHYVLLVDTYTGTPGGSQGAYNDCINNYPAQNWLAPPLFFASTMTAQTGGQNANSLVATYPMPAGTTVKYGLVVCQSVVGAIVGGGGYVTIYTDIPRRRTTQD